MKLYEMIRYAIAVTWLGTLLSNVVFATPSITQYLCGVVKEVQTIIGVLALLLFIAGGALYAVAHIMPAAGNLRGNLQGWSLGMVVGGIVGLILVIMAPFIISTIIAFGTNVSPLSC